MTNSGHVSARLPDEPAAFLIQPIDTPRSGLRPDDLLVRDFEGCFLDGRRIEGACRSGASLRIVHGAAGHESIVHVHHDRTNSFTPVENRPLLLVKNHAIRWRDGNPVHPDPAPVANAE